MKYLINYIINYRTSNSSVLTIVAFSLERYELFTGFNIFVVKGQNSIAVDRKIVKSIKSLYCSNMVIAVQGDSQRNI